MSLGVSMNERSVSVLERSPAGATQLERAFGRRLALVGTYPPTRCGIASFTASLRTALLEAGASRVDVVRVVEAGEPVASPPEVALTFRPDVPAEVQRAAAALSGYDAVILQHEFGIYGPGSGIAVLDLVAGIASPVIVTLHTVVDDPSAVQRRIIAGLAARESFTVALSDTAARLLVFRHGLDSSTVRVIPHGTETDDGGEGGDVVHPAGSLLVTWGLLGPGKGLDWALAALPRVREVVADVHWVIAGQTHPKVVAREGERYRDSLREALSTLGVEDNVTLVDAYLTRHQIRRMLQAASAVVLPYDSTQQTSSGVLMEAVAAGVPVVATAFPQAVEVAEKGGALVVPHRDPEALADALIHLLTDPAVAADLVVGQKSMAPEADWTEVGGRYLDLIEDAAPAIAS